MENSELIKRNMYIIGQTVKKLRRQKKWSQEYLSFMSGLDRTYIGGLERGERNATIGTLTTISKALNITLFQLVEEASKYESGNH